MADALAVLCEPLEGLGFHKSAGHVYTMELADGVLGWLGLNKATQHRRPGEVEVNLVVGVRHQRVQRLIAELTGEPFHEFLPPTVSTPIGYVMPAGRYTAWLVGAAGGADVTENLVAAVHQFGLPFMRDLVDLGNVRDAIDKRLGNDREYTLPVVLRLLGDEFAARAALDGAVDALGPRQDAAAARMRRFAEAFRAVRAGRS